MELRELWASAVPLLHTHTTRASLAHICLNGYGGATFCRLARRHYPVKGEEPFSARDRIPTSEALYSRTLWPRLGKAQQQNDTHSHHTQETALQGTDMRSLARAEKEEFAPEGSIPCCGWRPRTSDGLRIAHGQLGNLGASSCAACCATVSSAYTSSIAPCGNCCRFPVPSSASQAGSAGQLGRGAFWSKPGPRAGEDADRLFEEAGP